MLCFIVCVNVRPQVLTFWLRVYLFFFSHSLSLSYSWKLVKETITLMMFAFPFAAVDGFSRHAHRWQRHYGWRNVIICPITRHAFVLNALRNDLHKAPLGVKEDARVFFRGRPCETRAGRRALRRSGLAVSLLT